MNNSVAATSLTQEFEAPTNTLKQRDKRPPFTLRLTEDEPIWLDTSEDVEKQLEEACAAVFAMREALFIALGLRCGGDSS